MNPDATLSAVVLTRNSSALLERCLQSLKFADELIVIDDFSTDETAEISARCGAKVVKHAMNGDFSVVSGSSSADANGFCSLILMSWYRMSSLRRSSMFCKAERRQRIFSSVKTIFHITTLLTDR